MDLMLVLTSCSKDELSVSCTSRHECAGGGHKPAVPREIRYKNVLVGHLRLTRVKTAAMFA